MDSYIKWILILSALSQVGEGGGNIDQRLEHHIKRRSLREDGFVDFKTAMVQLSYDNEDGSEISFTSSRHFRDTMRLKRKPESEIIFLSVVGDDLHFEITLTHAKSVLKQSARVSISSGNQSSIASVRKHDCLMSGTVDGDKTKPVVMSYCDGLTGMITIGSDTYNIETIDDTDGVETVAIAKGNMTGFIDDITPGNIMGRHLDQNFGNKRQKRTLPGPLVIETAVILDEAFIAGLIKRGYTTEQSWYDFMTLRWMGVQVEWGRAELNYDVTIDVEGIAFLTTNPDWYNPVPSDLNRALDYCAGAKTNKLWQEFDHIHIFTTTSTNNIGKAHTSEMCRDGKKCAVSTGFNPVDYVVTAHEIGHCMGMSHDVDAGCPNNAGIMGYVAKTGWSSCSVEALYWFLRDEWGSACLFADNVDEDDVVNVQEAWPGMLFNDNEMCAKLYGEEFVYKDFPGNDPYDCVAFSCINMNRESVNYGVSRTVNDPIPGRYCGDEKVCTWKKVNSTYQCIFWNETGFNLTQFEKIHGGWAEWSSESTCSRSCGTGVRYRHRKCSNPESLNAAGCEGNDVSVTVCNTEACPGDSTDESAVILQRVGETCTHWKNNSLYELIGKNSSHYLESGSIYSNTDFGQCEVKCGKSVGNPAGSKERHGLMPDGTACTHPSLSSRAEVFKLPRWSGMTGRCVMGYCQILDCTGNTGDSRNDGCGICGGDNSTCQPIDSVYNTTLAKGAKDLITIIPAEATLIQFYFSYGDMKKYFLEVVMKDSPSTKVISSSTTNTHDNPVSYAGTQWYFRRSKQDLYALGPLTHAVHIQVVNNGNAVNQGIHYGYSLPPAAEMEGCTGQCENGGTWNQELCSCECAPDYYGLTCTDTCWKFCKNSQPFASTGCKCDCGGRTYGTSCDCKYPFTGIDCQDCKITECQNGGTFVSDECRCNCPPGYGGLDCSGPCEDANGNTATCLTNVDKGWCEDRNEKMEADCYKSCGLCEPASGTTTSKKTTPQEGTSTATSTTTTTPATKTTTSTTTPSTKTTPSTTTTTTSTTTTTTSTPSTTTKGYPNIPRTYNKCGSRSFLTVYSYLWCLLAIIFLN